MDHMQFVVAPAFKKSFRASVRGLWELTLKIPVGEKKPIGNLHNTHLSPRGGRDERRYLRSATDVSEGRKGGIYVPQAATVAKI